MSIMSKFHPFSNKNIFCEEPLQEITEELHNPARGWYQIHNFDLDQDVDFEELKWCLGKDDTLVLIMISIESYKEKDLDETAIQRMKAILDFFAVHKYDIILRVAYDHDGKALEREPYFFSQVETHMKQIREVLEAYSQEILIYQGLLVGNWGEMHTSRFLSEDKLRKLSDIIGNRKKNNAYLAVRKPSYWRILHSQTAETEIQSNMGLFDDGIFGGEHHLGTFAETAKENASWRESWNPQEELEFEEKLCQNVPNGGEVIYNAAYAEKLGKEKMVERLQQMHVTYLNRVHDGRMLYYWKQLYLTGQESFISEPELWNKKSFYEYVGAYLGYRFLIRKAEITSKNKNNEITVEIMIENTGFGAFYQDGELILEIEKISGEISWISIGQMKGWKSGEVRHCKGTMKAEQGKLFLWANRSWDKRIIRFANAADQNGRVMLGTFKG